MNERYLEIYLETQQLAAQLAQLDNFEAKPEAFHSEHKDFRMAGYFQKACAAQELLNKHEMTDLVEEVEDELAGQKSQYPLLSLDELILALEINADTDSENIDTTTLEYQAAQKLKELAKQNDRVGELEHMATQAKLLAEKETQFGGKHSDIAERIKENL